MKISVITVTFNSGNTLNETLESTIKQTYKNIEHIIIDGLSTDNTLQIVNKYEHISKIVSERDLGIYDAMNKGIALAKGEIIAILNSDDVFFDNLVLEKVSNFFEKNPNEMAVYGDLIYFSKLDSNVTFRYWKSKKYYENFFDDGHVIAHPSLFLRKEVYETTGKYYTNYKLAGDYEFMLRAFKIYKFKPHYIDEIFIKMRIGGASTKNLRNVILGNKEVYLSWERNCLKIPFKFYFKRYYYKIIQFLK